MTLTVNLMRRKKTTLLTRMGDFERLKTIRTRGDVKFCSMNRDVSVIKAKYSDTDAKLQNINEALNDKTLLTGLKRHVHLSEVNISSLHAIVRKVGVDVPTLARNLGISLEVAKQTRDVTTQRGVKSMIYPSLNRRRSTNFQHMK
jgi:hypothetical protein